jgi:hypothetical protein
MYMAVLTTARIAAFIPEASPPLVKTASLCKRIPPINQSIFVVNFIGAIE